MAHPRHEEQAAPAADDGRTAVRASHPLVVVDRVEGREPGVADAVVEDELPAAARERVEVGPARGGGERHLRVGGRLRGPLVHVHLRRGEGRTDGVQAAGEQARDALRRGDPGVEQEAGIHLPPPRVLRTAEGPDESIRLRPRQAALGLRTAARQRGGVEAAPRRVGDDAVLQAVGAVARREQAVDHQLAVGVGERPAGVRLPGGVEGRHLVDHRRHPLVPNAGEVRAHGRRADHDAVEGGWIALRHQHALAPAGRAAHEVRVGGGTAVVPREDLLRQHRDAPDRLVGEVEARLLVGHEGGVEHLAAMAGVGGDDREAAGERRVALSRSSERGRDSAVQAAAALEQQASVPFGGKCYREPDAVRPAVGTRAAVDRRAQLAVGGQRHGERGHPGRLRRRRRARGEPLGRHLRECHARQLELPQLRARRLASRGLRQGRARGQRSQQDDQGRATRDREPHCYLRQAELTRATRYSLTMPGTVPGQESRGTTWV